MARATLTVGPSLVREIAFPLRLADDLVSAEEEADPDERVVARSLRARAAVLGCSLSIAPNVA